LAPGRYVVRFADAVGTMQEFDVETGHAPYELTLAGQLLTLHVTDTPRQPLPGIVVGARGWLAEHAPGPDVVASAGTSGPALDELPHDLDFAGSVTNSTATQTFLLPWGSTWLFDVAVRGAVPASAMWTAISGVASADLDLPLRPLEATGRLIVQAVDD